MSKVFHLNIYFETKVKLNPEFVFFPDFCIKKFLKKQNTFHHGINVAYCLIVLICFLCSSSLVVR